MAVSGILMVDVDVLDVMEGVVFDIVGFDGVVVSDKDVGYHTSTHQLVRREPACMQVPYWWWM
jgi:hypothetical protein